MSVLFIALPIALLLGAAGMLACVLCIRYGQYDDLETPAVRILIDEEESPKRPSEPLDS
ncbi:MAG: cbb3-type cytochrome oxidase assembly protein CcoS [Pirellulaceae bacterium]|nr:cbb3-type cytochrome oxidase assembly protein CcoS [Pirellulaceae bacterium]